MKEVLKTDNLYPIESWYLYDISKHGDALKRQWFNEFSGSETLSLPELNQKMIEKVFVEDHFWKEAINIIDIVTKRGPHLVMFKKVGSLKKVLGTLRLKKLNKCYDHTDEQYRLYIQQPFVDNLFRKGDYCALTSNVVADDLYKILNRRVSSKEIINIILAVKRYEPEKAFDYIMSKTKSISFMQFLPVGVKYIVPLINQAAKVSVEMDINFITTTLEEDIVSDAIFGIEKLYNQINGKSDNCVCIVAKNNNFICSHTGIGHKTWVLLIDCLLAANISDFILRNNLSIKSIRLGREKRDEK